MWINLTDIKMNEEARYTRMYTVLFYLFEVLE